MLNVFVHFGPREMWNKRQSQGAYANIVHIPTNIGVVRGTVSVATIVVVSAGVDI